MKSNMKKFKKLVMLEFIGLLLVAMCMALIYAGYSTSEIRLALVALLVVVMNYNLFLIFYYFKNVKESES